MGVRELSDGGPDGTRLGQSTTDKVSFWGATPVVKQTGFAAIVATATTAMSTTLTISAGNSATVFALSSETVAKEIVKCVAEMQVDLASVVANINLTRTALVNVGLITSS